MRSEPSGRGPDRHVRSAASEGAVPPGAQSFEIVGPEMGTGDYRGIVCSNPAHGIGHQGRQQVQGLIPINSPRVSSRL